MFEQSPHSLYLSLLDHDYDIKQSFDPEWWIISSNNYKLLIQSKLGALNILDSRTGSSFNFPRIDLYFDEDYENDYEDINGAVKEFVSVIKKSLNPQNIEVMKLIICQLIMDYPDILKLKFQTLDLKDLETLRALDQNSKIYIIKDKYKNIFNYLDSFYFINNLELSPGISLKDITNHILLNNFNESLKLKKDLKIDLKIIKKMDKK